MKAQIRILLSLLCLATVHPHLAAAERVLISEFLAANSGGQLDQDGEASDWVELYNGTSATVNLGGWHLTDDAADLTKWTLPATNLAPGRFLLVFASGKNRAVAGGELHANFQLDAAGEYLGLVRPDGATVEFDYAPSFPPQATGISYGAFPQTSTSLFLTDGKPIKWRIPASSADQGSDWTSQTFDDSAWQGGVLPAGFDAGSISGGGSGTTTNLARGRTATQSSTLSIFNAGLAVDGNLGNFTHTLAGNKLPATWEVNLGTNAFIEEIVLNNRGDGCCASRLRDITVYILSPDGAKTNFASVLLNPENVLGGGGSTGPASLTLSLRELTGSAVQGGRVKVVRTPDPDLSGTGGAGNSDEKDVLSLGEVVVNGSVAPASFQSIVRTDLQTPMRNQNASALLRIPFLVVLDEVPTLDSLRLRMRYDDGFVAYLNGVKVAEVNAPGAPTWNSTATAEHPDALALQFQDFDLTVHQGLLQDGMNVVAVQGLNQTAADDDFLIAPELVGQALGVITFEYYTQPSPGALNLAGTTGLVADTKFSADRGFFDQPFELAITCATPGAEIRYTTNGTAPTAVTGIVYSGPIPINRTTVVRAMATKPGWTPTDVDTHTYVFLEQVVAQSHRSVTNAGYPNVWPSTPTGGSVAADYAMDTRITTNSANAPLMTASLRALPSVFFSTSISNLFDGNRGLYSNPTSHGIDWERPASMEMLDTNGATEFQQDCGLRIQGGYFRDANVTQKHSLRVLFKALYGAGKLRHDLFKTDDAVREFDTLVLRAGANDGYAWDAAKDTEQFIRNNFGTGIHREMGHPAPHALFVHVYFNGIYWGIYELCERPNEDFSASYFGGDALEWDSNNAGDVKNGDINAWTAFTGLTTRAKTLTDYETMQGNNPDGSRNPALPVYLDKLNYIDYMMANIWGGNWDWPNKNFWFGRDRTTNSTGFKFYMWDFENTMGNNRDRSPLNMVSPRSGTEDSWVGQPHFYLKRLAEYKMDFADRVHRYFFNGGALTPNVLIRRYSEIANRIELAILAETARWGDDNLNPPQDIDDWRRERDWILGTYLPQRSDVVFKQFRSAGLYPTLGAPVLNQFGGTVAPGFQLQLTHTNAAGEIYFTVNGTDPRLVGGGLSPIAQLYNGPFPINGNLFLRARVKNSTNWSALVEAPFTTTGVFRDLVVSEVMYNPAPSTTLGGDEFEFIELMNTGSSALDLTGLSFVSGISFSFTNGTPLAAGSSLVLVRNAAAFRSRYPAAAYHGVYGGSLGNNGETLTLAHDLLGEILSFTYGDEVPWPVAADGLGFSLVLRTPSPTTDLDDPASWRASAATGGSPGSPELEPFFPPVVINEVLSRASTGGEFIELYNPSAAPADIGGWFLSDDAAAPRKYRFPQGTTIPTRGFLTVDQSKFNPAGSTNAFRLNASGDDIYLFSGNSSSNLTGYSHGFRFGSSPENVTFGRLLLSTGREDFALQTSNTPGAANSGPRFGPMIITEIQYNPPPGDPAFVEIRNTSANPESLFDPAHPTNTWRLNGVGFSFPAGTTLQPNQVAILSEVDPAAFRTRYSLPEGVLVFGPFTGTLQNSGELLELQRPDAPGATTLDYLTVDAVRYNDHAPWPSAADGAGPSLQRIGTTVYGNDPANWIAAQPTPGDGWTAGVRPSITTQPRSAVAVAYGTTNFTTSALGDPPLNYQWRFNGEAIPGATSPLLVLSNLQPAQAGRYSVVVFGPGGSVVSSNAFLNLLIPATIITQPRSTVGTLGSNVTFTVSAVSDTPLSYQWRFNGLPIQNATTATLTLRNLTFQSGGNYTCVITDGVGAVETQPATLTIVVRPVVTQPPVPLVVPVGGTATFSVSAEGTLPLTFRWRRNGTVITNYILNQNVSFLTVTNVQGATATRYSVTVTNIAGAAPTTAEVTLSASLDTDGDGMPDDWETANGLSPTDPTDALADPDGDTHNNQAEYLAGTDPKDRLSYLRVTDIDGSLDAIGLEFVAISNRTYSVLHRAKLADTNWLVLTNLPARTTNRLEKVVDPARGTPGRYYRLVTPGLP